MSAREITEAVMELPERERLDLARNIIANITAEQKVSAEIVRAVQGMEDIVTGKLRGLDEEEFRAALK